MMKKFFLFLLVVGLVAAAFAVGGGFSGARSRGAGGEAEKKSATVRRGPIDVTISATGKVVAHQVVEVKSKASGEIVRVVPDIGDAVERGQLVLELDPQDEERAVARFEAQAQMEEARLESARASLELARSEFTRGVETAQSDVQSAEAALDEARARFERQRELQRQGAISAQELETVRSAYLQAQAAREAALALQADRGQQRFLILQREQDIAFQEAQLRNARVALDEARERLNETRIMAPIAGTLTGKEVEVGQVISSAISNVGGGTTLLTVSDLSRLYVEASVDEVDIGQIALGQRAVITADAYPAERFVGRVNRIAPQGQELNNVVIFSVRLEVEGDGLRLLKPGMTVNVLIEAGRREDALLIPINAIFYSEDDSESYVLRDDAPTEAKATKVYFSAGLSDGLNVEVLDGLSEGDEIKVKSAVENSRWRR